MRKRQKGFSLIELLIVVAIILIIAAIAIPNLIKSRLAANEASASQSLRTYVTSMIHYSTQCPSLGFPTALNLIGPSAAGTCLAGTGDMDAVMTTAPVTKSGYKFVYTPGAADASGLINTFTVSAVPSVIGTTGQRGFVVDQTGVICYMPDGTIPGLPCAAGNVLQ